MTKKNLLLHTCCAPCATVPVERLGSDYEITCLFYNPNIYPPEEYFKRLNELQNMAGKLQIQVIVPENDSDRWFKHVAGLENEPEGGKRCAICFRLRLEQTAMYAKDKNFAIFTTTLTTSPYKNAKLIHHIGIQLGEQYHLMFLTEDFKQKNGYRQSIELSKNLNLFRQNYCGCCYSKKLT